MKRILEWLRAVPGWLWAALGTAGAILFVWGRERRAASLRRVWQQRAARAEARALTTRATERADGAMREATRAAEERELVQDEVRRELEHIDQAGEDELAEEYRELARRKLRERRGLK